MDHEGRHVLSCVALKRLCRGKRLEDNLNAFRKESRENLSKVERLLLKALNRAVEEIMHRSCRFRRWYTMMHRVMLCYVIYTSYCIHAIL